MLRFILLAITFSLTITSTLTLAGEDAFALSQLWIGTATTSITPDQPVSLHGSMHERIASKVESPLMANVVVLESRQGGKILDTAVMISCDLCVIPTELSEMTLQELQKRLPELDPQKVIFSATHTHTGPMTRRGIDVPEGVMTTEAYQKFFVQRVAMAVEKAWKAKKPGGVSWGLGHAVVAYNRRTVYADGSAVMYGDVHNDRFRELEGPEDHGVEVLFFWDENKKPIAAAINVACPAQEVEIRKAVNADFWHPVREALKAKRGKDFCVLAWIGAAGDQSPHFKHRSAYRKRADERMRELRGMTHLEEIARRITRAVDDVYEATKSDIHNDAPLVHVTKELKLPRRMVTEKEYNDAKAEIARLEKAKDTTFKTRWHSNVVKCYESQKPDDTHDVVVHVLRLGDVAIATNPFELFTNYGIQMKARSKALQTFVIQLAGSGSYLPTAKAVQGGGYSAVIQSNKVGPRGGQVLVDRTVETINSLWSDKK